MRSFKCVLALLIVVSVINCCDASDRYHRNKRYYGNNCSKCHVKKAAPVKVETIEKTTVVNNLLAPQVLMPLMLQAPVKVEPQLQFKPVTFKDNFPQPVKADPYKSPFVAQQVVNVGGGYFIQNSVQIKTTTTKTSQSQAVQAQSSGVCVDGKCYPKATTESSEHKDERAEQEQPTEYGYKEEVLGSIKGLNK